MTALHQEQKVRGGSDADRVISGLDGLPVASCSLWWRETPVYGDHKVGLIGRYAAADDPSAKKLLSAACDELRDHGCTLAIGPMDGSTWHSYRFVTKKGVDAPFAIEPENPDSWPEQFRTFGFNTLASYTSSLTEIYGAEDPRLNRARSRFEKNGICIRTLDSNPDHFKEEMRRIFHLAQISFQNNFLYSPISEDEFLNLYLPIQSMIDPNLVLIAERDEEVVAFLFMIPDFKRAMNGSRSDTAILKTVAVLPEKANAGLGSFLVAYSHVCAFEQGYHRVIHALMHDDNASMNISRKTAKPIRTYELFAKEL